MNTNMVAFNTEELSQKASDAGLTLTDLSLRAGMSRDYLSHAMRMGLINLNVLTKTYEILGQSPQGNKPKRKEKTVNRHMSRSRLTISGSHCREVIQSKGWTINYVAGQLNVTGPAVSKWLREDYLPENLLDEFAEILGISTEEILTGWAPLVPEQMELVLDYGEGETGEPLYTADDVKDMMRKFVSDFADRIMDYLGEAIEGYKKEDADGRI